VEHFNKKVVLVVEYNGGRYYGFQWQTDLLTIQSELERSIRNLTGENKRVSAASRTDTGVHARGQVVSFWTNSNLTPDTIIRALNHYLPDDIVVKAACNVDEDFNVRRNALSREYEYRILNSTIRSPLLEGFVYMVYKKLNLRNLRKACKLLKGEHDFISFATSMYDERNTVRTVYEARINAEKDDIVTFNMVANSFLPHQVRNTVGLLTRVGLGQVGLEEFGRIMEAKKVGLAGPTAPACGLYLTRINYPRNLERKYANLFN
jgi:tRNA pseudouridine38-40 synthase